MKRIACLFVAALLSCSANAVVIDFDTLPDGSALASGTALSTQYATLGVTFSAYENGLAVDSYVLNVLGSNYWYNCVVPTCYPNVPDNRADVIRIDFDGVGSNVSWITDTEGLPYNPIVFNAYDAAGTLLETHSISTSGTAIPMSFLASNIAYIEMLQPVDPPNTIIGDAWAWGLDNLTFDVIRPVPEPATLGLLGIGLVGLGYWRKRRVS